MRNTQPLPTNPANVTRAETPSDLPGHKSQHFEITSQDTHVGCPGRFYMSGTPEAIIRELSYEYDVPFAELGIIIQDAREALAETADQLPLPKKSGPAFVLYHDVDDDLDCGLECVVRPLNGGCAVQLTGRGLILH